MKIIKQWRDLKTDPKEINFKKIEIKKILTYPHAGNDVVGCSYIENEKTKNCFVKIERSDKANFKQEVINIDLLKTNNFYLNIPDVIESGYVDDKKYIVLSEIKGKRLSEIFAKDTSKKEDYLIKYGKELAIIHQIPIDKFELATQRPINKLPEEERAATTPELKPYIDYLIKNEPEINFNTFIHGDFHYANVYWKNNKLSGVLDWEYSGKGFKEQDIAWSLVLRNSQLFMDNTDDIKLFLKGYKKIGDYNKNYLKWCLINGYCHFYIMFPNDLEYRKKLEFLMEAIKKIDL